MIINILETLQRTHREKFNAFYCSQADEDHDRYHLPYHQGLEFDNLLYPVSARDRNQSV